MSFNNRENAFQNSNQCGNLQPSLQNAIYCVSVPPPLIHHPVTQYQQLTYIPKTIPQMSQHQLSVANGAIQTATYPYAYQKQNQFMHQPPIFQNMPNQYRPPFVSQQHQPPKPFLLKTPLNFKRRKPDDGEKQESVNLSMDNSPKKLGTTGMEIDGSFYELQCFAMEACKYAEKIAQGYRKRPCFKKIELLLSRLKQDLTFHPNIVSNINSQGTAWAIKDLVFALSRIINAWVILRGYVYDKAAELDKLRENFDPEFGESFVQWQKSTLKMQRALMRSVSSMDATAQNTSNTKNSQVFEPFLSNDNEEKQYGEDFLKDFQENLFSPMYAPNSEEIQLRNHQTSSYFTAGVFKPLLTNSSVTSSPLPPDTAYSSSSTMSSPVESDSVDWLTDISNSPMYGSQSSSERLYNRGKSQPSTPNDSSPSNPFERAFDKAINAKKGLTEKFNSMNFGSPKIEDDYKNVNIEDLVDFHYIDNDDDISLDQMYKKDSMKITYLLTEVTKISHVDDFSFCISFITKNIKSGKYGKFADILCEFKSLISHAKTKLKDADETKKTSLKAFISALDALLHRKAFA